MRLTPIIVLLLVAGCLDAPADTPGTQAPVEPEPTPTPTVTSPPAEPEPEPLAMRTLAKGSFSGIHNDTRELIRDQDEWAALWERHASREPRPEVDMPNETIVAVVVHGPTGCAAIHIGSVNYHADEEIIDIEIVHEDASEIQCFVAMEDVYHFVAIPSREGVASYREIEAEHAVV